MFEICFEFQNFAILFFGVHTTGFDSQLALGRRRNRAGSRDEAQICENAGPDEIRAKFISNYFFNIVSILL